MLQYDRQDVVSRRLRWAELTPAEWRERDELSMAEFLATGIFQAYEKEYFRKDGSRVPVLSWRREHSKCERGRRVRPRFERTKARRGKDPKK